MLLEQSYVDLKYEPSAKFMKMGKKKGRIDVSLTNRSDMRIENVRVFLCIHATGMYKDDYDVVKIPESKSVVGPYATAVSKMLILRHDSSMILPVSAQSS